MLGVCSLVLVDGGLCWLVFISSSGWQDYTGLCSLFLVNGLPILACLTACLCWLVLWFKWMTA